MTLPKKEVTHVSQEAMVKILEASSKTWQKLVPKWVNVSAIPATWEASIGEALGTVFPEKNNGQKDVLARKFIESVWNEAHREEEYRHDGTQLRTMDENMLARKFTRFIQELSKGAKQDDYGSDAALHVWKQIVKARDESFEAVSQTKSTINRLYHRKNYEPRYRLAFHMKALNKVLEQARHIQFKKRQSNIRLVKFISLLVIAAAILTYSNKKKIYRFARTQFRKMMDAWRRFRGRPEIYDTLEKLESSGRIESGGIKGAKGTGRVRSPKSSEQSIDAALTAIMLDKGYGTKSMYDASGKRSPKSSASPKSRTSRTSSDEKEKNKRVIFKRKWLELRVDPLTPSPKPRRR